MRGSAPGRVAFSARFAGHQLERRLPSQHGPVLARGRQRPSRHGRCGPRAGTPPALRLDADLSSAPEHAQRGLRLTVRERRADYDRSQRARHPPMRRRGPQGIAHSRGGSPAPRRAGGISRRSCCRGRLPERGRDRRRRRRGGLLPSTPRRTWCCCASTLPGPGGFEVMRMLWPWSLDGSRLPVLVLEGAGSKTRSGPMHSRAAPATSPALRSTHRPCSLACATWRA